MMPNGGGPYVHHGYDGAANSSPLSNPTVPPGYSYTPHGYPYSVRPPGYPRPPQQ